MKKNRWMALGASGVFALGLAWGFKLRPGPHLSSDLRSHDDQSKVISVARISASLHDNSSLLARQSRLLEALARITPAACQELLEEHDGNETLTRQLAARWAELDPHSLFSYLTDPRSARRLKLRNLALDAAMAVWAETDPEAALEAGRSAPRFEERNLAIRSLIGHLLYRDPEQALEVVRDSLARNEEVLGSFRDFADWSDGDRAVAADLLLTLPRCKFRMRTAADLCRRWAADDPAAAAAFAERLDPQARASAMESAVVGWVKKDLTGAREYLESLGGAAQSRLGRFLVAEWGPQDPNATFEWIDRHLEGRPRRQAIEDLVQVSVGNHAEQLSGLVGALPVGELKQGALETVSRTWFEQAPREAVEWLLKQETGFARDAVNRGFERAHLDAAVRAEIENRIQTAEPPE